MALSKLMDTIYYNTMKKIIILIIASIMMYSCTEVDYQIEPISRDVVVLNGDTIHTK